MPDNIDKLLAAAATAHRASQYAETQRIAGEILAGDPDNVSAKFLLGVSLARCREFQQAWEHLEQVLQSEPNSFEVLTSLSGVYRDGGRYGDAIRTALRAVQIKPKEAQAHNHLGRCFLSARRLEEAADAFLQAVALQPGFASAYFNLGKVRQLEGQDGEAAICFGRAASLQPSLPHLLAYGQSLLALYDLQSATDCAQRCVAMYPKSAGAHLLLCGCLTELGRYEDAEKHLQIAQELDAGGEEALQMAARQRPLGHIEEANQSLCRAIDLNPGQISAYDSLIQNHRVTESDRPLVDKLSALLESGGLSPTELVSAHYGLGKAHEDLGEYERAMHHYDEANFLTRRLKFGDVPFDQDAYRAKLDRVIDLASQPAATPCESELPILIVGVMRSGTSLVEQILSSHPLVAGAGEQLYWMRNWPDPSGEEYVRELAALGPDARHVTDKMPGNAIFAGLIHRALPNARFIHIRRNPVDTCLSIWATPNHMPQDGGNRKKDIVFVYRQYIRMMEHWRQTIPADRLLEIDYETLVANPEPVVRAMLEFCNLEWEEQCLHPEQNKRLVKTPSAWQVRQPLYKTSVARWQRFEPWLGEFAELLSVQHP